MGEVPPASEMLVWDPKGEWRIKFGLKPITRLSELHTLIVESLRTGARLRVAYVGPMSRAHFEVFAKLAWVWIKAGRRRVLVVEELADVTHPGKAPDAWGEILRKSRDPWQAIVIATTQRVAESDKTIAGNCAIIHAGFQSFPRDRTTIAGYLDVPVRMVTELPEHAFIERDMRSRQLRTG